MDTCFSNLKIEVGSTAFGSPSIESHVPGGKLEISKDLRDSR